MSIYEQINQILKKEGYSVGYTIDFPQYNILPDEVKLSLSILEKHQMRVTLLLKPIKEPVAIK